MSDKTIVKLREPVQFGSETIEQLEFRKGTAKDFRDLPLEPKVGDFMNVAAKLAGHPPSVIDGLDPIDLGEVLDAVGKLFERGLGIGNKE